MDLLQGVQEGVQENNPEDMEQVPDMNVGEDFQMPSIEQLIELIGGANLTEEEKRAFIEDITKSQTNKAGPPEVGVFDQFVFLLIPVSIIALVFGKNTFFSDLFLFLAFFLDTYGL